MVLGCQGVDKLLRTVLNILISLSLDKVTHKAPPTQPGVTARQQESGCTSDRFFFLAAAAKSLQSCPTLCDPIDGSPPGSPVPGILQARTLEWVAISFSKQKQRGRGKCMMTLDLWLH